MDIKIDNRLFLDFRGRLEAWTALHSWLLMGGKKGCSGGWRPGAGRKPRTTQIKSKAKSKSIKKSRKKAWGGD